MPVFDTLKRASFNGVDFPVTEVEVTGGIRDHIHEYPHADGGSPEKMGRRLYLIKMHGDFQATFRRYPKLWPEGLGKLRGFFEKQLTGPLVIPTVGSIKAYARTWTQTMAPKQSRSGEQGTFEFVEDQDSNSLTKALITVNAGSLAAKLQLYDGKKALTLFAKTADIGLFDLVSNAVNSVLAIGDLAGAAINLVQAKLLAVTSLCGQVSDCATAKDGRNAPIISALHDLWDTAQQSNADLFKVQARPLIYVVPTTMAMSSVSIALYGDTKHTVELMQLNSVDDLFAVRAGTKITYIAQAVSLPGGTVDVSRTTRGTNPASTF